MGFLGNIFGGKKPAQPASPGGIETGIPAGAPPTARLNSNTMGGLLPTSPVVEQPATGNIEETGTWAAAKSALDAQRVTAAASLTPATSTSPMGTFGVSPTPEAIAFVQDGPTKINEGFTPSPAAPETPLTSAPIETPAEQFAVPVAEVTEIKSPDTGPTTGETVAESQTPVDAPVSHDIETPETPPPPPFSMDAITAEPEIPTPAAASTDGEEPPTIPDVAEQPVATVDPVAETTEEAKTDGNDGLEPLGNAGAEQPAAPEPAAEVASAEPASEPAQAVETPAEERSDNIVPFPAAAAPPAEAPAAAQTDLPLAA